MGRRVDSTFEVVEYSPGGMVKAKSISGSFPITFTRSVEAARGGGTKVTAIVEGDATGFVRIAGPILSWMVKRSIESDYRNLKRILEKQSV
jgi:hypothetical protein